MKQLRNYTLLVIFLTGSTVIFNIGLNYFIDNYWINSGLTALVSFLVGMYVYTKARKLFNELTNKNK